MASVIKRRESKFWIACFTSRDGRQLKRSTKTLDKRAALRIAEEIEAVERKSRSSDLTTNQLQKVFSDVSERVTGDRMDVPTIQEYFRSWLQAVQNKNASSTLVRYDCTVRLFLAFLGKKVNQPITSVTPGHIDGFMNYRIEAGMASKTVTTDIKTLGIAFRKAERYGVIIKNPVPAVELPKVESSEREVFTPKEIEKLLIAATSLDWQTAILLGYFVGARLSDCIHMKWADVNPDQKTITYVQKKTHKKVIVPIHFHLLKHLVYLSSHNNEGYICTSLAAKTPGGKHGLSESFKRIVTRAGVDLGIVQGKGIRKFTKRSFHSLRHSFATALANAGVPEEIRMKLTGHSSKEIHAKYSHFDMKALEDAIDSLSLTEANLS